MCFCNRNKPRRLWLLLLSFIVGSAQLPPAMLGSLTLPLLTSLLELRLHIFLMTFTRGALLPSDADPALAVAVVAGAPIVAGTSDGKSNYSATTSQRKLSQKARSSTAGETVLAQKKSQLTLIVCQKGISYLPVPTQSTQSRYRLAVGVSKFEASWSVFEFSVAEFPLLHTHTLLASCFPSCSPLLTLLVSD